MLMWVLVLLALVLLVVVLIPPKSGIAEELVAALDVADGVSTGSGWVNVGECSSSSPS